MRSPRTWMIKENSLNSRERALRPGESISISILGDYFALTKPRLLFIVLMSTLIGYLLPAGSIINFTLFQLIFGTALTGAGAHVLNQWQERSQDARMMRTKQRLSLRGDWSRKKPSFLELFFQYLGFPISH